MTVYIRIPDDRHVSEYVRYICEAFKYITNTDVEFRFKEKGGDIGPHDCVINYGMPPEGGCINIPMVCSPIHAEDYCYGKCNTSFFKDSRLNDVALPVYRQLLKTQRAGDSVVFSEVSSGKPLISCEGNGRKGINVHFDLFYNIFCVLGNIPDKTFEEKHGIAHSYAKFIRKDRAFYRKPWVNYFFIVFQSLIEAMAGKGLTSQSSGHLRFHVLMMYDVDALRKTAVMQTKQLLFIAVNVLRCFLKVDFKKFFSEGKRLVRFIFTRCNYLCFEEIVLQEEPFKISSVFNIYQKLNHRGMKKIKSLIFDPAYDISREAQAKEAIKALIRRGKSAGLHSGYNSFVSSAGLALQKSKLSETLHCPVRGIRQHWLRFSVKDTWKAQEEAGFLYDASFGFNDAIGFRSGLAHPFFPYSHQETRRYRVLEVPPVLMDSTLMHYSNCSEERAFTEAVEILNEVKKFAGTCAIVWHQESFCRDYGWGNLLKRILGWVADNGGSFISEQELLSQHNLLR
ncbi:MAG: hypothetical protein AB1530_06165 [Candidatus Omnitrophota bacterium]